MAVAVYVNKKLNKPVQRVPRTLRARVEPLLAENYAYMDSPVFRRKYIEAELFTFEEGIEPALPLTSWYQPTRDEAIEEGFSGAPQLMKGAEERLMFLRYNYSKLRLSRLQRAIKRDGLTREREVLRALLAGLRVGDQAEVEEGRVTEGDRERREVRLRQRRRGLGRGLCGFFRTGAALVDDDEAALTLLLRAHGPSGTRAAASIFAISRWAIAMRCSAVALAPTATMARAIGR